MKNKLQLSDIACYLPYGLEYRRETDGYTTTVYRLFDAWDCHNTQNNNGAVVPNHLPPGFKPVLRPMSMLYQTIVHEGKEEVPIVELAKLAYCDGEWEVCDTDGVSYLCKVNNVEFGYDTKTKGFGCFLFGESKFIPNQYDLFEFLNSRFFDYRGLIEKGLAIKMEE